MDHLMGLTIMAGGKIGQDWDYLDQVGTVGREHRCQVLEGQQMVWQSEDWQQVS